MDDNDLQHMRWGPELGTSERGHISLYAKSDKFIMDLGPAPPPGEDGLTAQQVVEML